ncbi:major tail protein [Halalkalibacterium halodurans]|uniref:major tail protein n=1 Tax=Halalkalibacterium halodurans TaxID=86665 RepID=UPI002AAA5EC6|nr:major tail protein [Halalkalibacterium halodurans]MDY7222088.1 major tail protein [Halalkalibacterium halodurans]MDY7243893.1 major tail protein [Halalkalibacterium halodurans]
MSEGKPIVGLRDIHYAILSSDGVDGTEYETPKRIVGGINVSITPTVNDSTLYADDGPSENDASLGEIGVALNTKGLPKEAQADLLGHKVNSDGVLVKSTNDQAPYVALGFRSLLSGGGYRYVWLYKGRFRPQEQNYQTKGENIEYQTPTINATFVRRESDDQWQAVVDQNDPDIAPGVIENWFNEVYEEASEV